MHFRIAVLVSIGILAGAAIYIGADYYAWKNRPRSAFAIHQEEMRDQMAADMAFLRAQAKTKDEKLYVSFLERSSRAANLNQEGRAIRISNGIDQYEAWTLARIYALSTFGGCGLVGIPTEVAGAWIVPIGVGRAAKPYTLTVLSLSGSVSCDGYPTIPASVLLDRS